MNEFMLGTPPPPLETVSQETPPAAVEEAINTFPLVPIPFAVHVVPLATMIFPVVVAKPFMSLNLPGKLNVCAEPEDTMVKLP